MIDSTDKTLLWGGARIYQLWAKRLEVCTVYAVFWIVLSVVLWIPCWIIFAVASIHGAVIAAIPLALGLGLVISLLVMVLSRFGTLWGISRHIEHPDRTAIERAVTIAESLCSQVGLEMPEIVTLNSAAINATSMSLGSGKSMICLTTGAVSSLSLVQLEAVMAREVARVRSGLSRYDAMLGMPRKIVALLSFGGYPRSLKESYAREVEMVDLAALTISRFPPALAETLEMVINADDGRADIALGVARATSWQWLYPWVYRDAKSLTQLRVEELREW